VTVSRGDATWGIPAGRVHRPNAEIHEAAVEALVSASPASKQDFIGITPSSVTGPRFRKIGADPSAPAPTDAPIGGAHGPERPLGDERQWPGSERKEGGGPFPIPHFPPRRTS